MADYGLFGTARDKITGRQKQLDQLTDSQLEDRQTGADQTSGAPVGGITQQQFSGAARSEADKARAKAALAAMLAKRSASSD